MAVTVGDIRQPVGGRCRNTLKLKYLFLLSLSVKILYQEFRGHSLAKLGVRGVFYIDGCNPHPNSLCFSLWPLWSGLKVRINDLRVEIQLLGPIIWPHMNTWLLE